MCKNQKYNVCIVIARVGARYVFSNCNDFQAIIYSKYLLK